MQKWLQQYCAPAHVNILHHMPSIYYAQRCITLDVLGICMAIQMRYTYMFSFGCFVWCRPCRYVYVMLFVNITINVGFHICCCVFFLCSLSCFVPSCHGKFCHGFDIMLCCMCFVLFVPHVLPIRILHVVVFCISNCFFCRVLACLFFGVLCCRGVFVRNIVARCAVLCGIVLFGVDVFCVMLFCIIVLSCVMVRTCFVLFYLI